MLKQFKEFLLKQNAVALAIGVIIGAAIGKVVSAIVEDAINPVIGLLLPGGDWRNAKIVLAHGLDAAGKPTESAITYGHLIGSAVDFVIIAFVVYMIGRAFLPKPAAAPVTKECPQCKEVIPIAATRCKSCTQVVA
ncbi:MAG TPA: large conductance mechanosensitive channel protein MscL [Thermoanaerobaculia bacterium]|jgi:large conductance mechanosensitive channel|nr:large conductance mechanosensitive channel protein MscL [Thermoanaerobaculia bacterium]